MNRLSIIGGLVASIVAAPSAAAQAHDHDHGHGTESASVSLEAQLAGLRAATERYRDFEVARAEGFVRFGRAEGALMGEHWYREDVVDQPLDLARPSTLQYAVIDGERVLVGVAYTIYQRPGEPLPEGFAGSSDHWHMHDVTKIARTATEGRPLLRWIVDRRIDRGKVGMPGGRTQLVMVHAWPWLENPDGLFAEQHTVLPYLRAGLPAEFAEGASIDAAWGVALLQDGACGAELDRLHFAARLTRTQRRDLGRACEEAAERVAAAPSSTAAELNEAAEAAWRGYVSTRDRALTPDQHDRLSSLVEHPMAMQ